MSDTTTCPECVATLPSTAAFCTSCGHRMAAETAPTGGDETRIDQPGLLDATQSYAASATTAPATTPPPAPWQPAEGGAPPTAAPPWQQAQQPAAPQQWGAPMGAPQTASSSTGGSVLGGAAGILGAVLALVGLFTAWVGFNGNRDAITGWDLTTGDAAIKSSDPYIILALAIAALVIGIVLFTGTARSIVRILTIVCGIAIVAITAYDWLSVVDVAKGFSKDVELTAQFGFYLTIAGGVVVALAGLMPAKKSVA